MLHVYIVRFNIIKNLKNFIKFLGKLNKAAVLRRLRGKKNAAEDSGAKKR